MDVAAVSAKVKADDLNIIKSTLSLSIQVRASTCNQQWEPVRNTARPPALDVLYGTGDSRSFQCRVFNRD
jgi:hypothetical protein